MNFGSRGRLAGQAESALRSARSSGHRHYPPPGDGGPRRAPNPWHLVAVITGVNWTLAWVLLALLVPTNALAAG